MVKMAKTRIAVPITANSLKAAIKDIAAANKVADIIELRLDFLKITPKSKDIGALLKACERPAICTCRPEREGGKFYGSEDERLAILRNCIEAWTDFVDVEISSELNFRKEILSLAAEKGVKTILSSHFLDRTPPRPELDNLFADMEREKPFAAKIIGTAQSDKDNDRIIEFLRQHNRKGTKIIAFCMGKIGVRSRIESARHGSFLAFASLGKGKESAQGQLGTNQMRKKKNAASGRGF